MFKTYTVAESLFQMNMFMTMQMYRALSNMTYIAEELTASEEPEELQEAAEARPPEQIRHKTAA